jgi:hypothetical protein
MLLTPILLESTHHAFSINTDVRCLVVAPGTVNDLVRVAIEKSLTPRHAVELALFGTFRVRDPTGTPGDLPLANSLKKISLRSLIKSPLKRLQVVLGALLCSQVGRPGRTVLRENGEEGQCLRGFFKP